MSGRGGQTGKGDVRGYFAIEPDPKLVERAFNELGEDFKDWRSVWTQVWPVMRRSIQDALATRGGAIGKIWPTYTQDYARRKARGTVRKGLGAGQGRSTELFFTGALREQLTGDGGLLKMTKRVVAFGSNVPHSRAVNFGKGRMGARWFVGWTPGAKGAVQEELNEFGASAVRRWSQKMDFASRGTF